MTLEGVLFVSDGTLEMALGESGEQGDLGWWGMLRVLGGREGLRLRG